MPQRKHIKPEPYLAPDNDPIWNWLAVVIILAVMGVVTVLVSTWQIVKHILQ